MKQTLKRLLRKVSRPLVNELEVDRGAVFVNNESAAQKALMQNYRLLAAQCPEQLPPLNDVGFRKYSQFEEDGMLLYLFSLIPPVNRTCVEICAGHGRECMTANLILNHGWWGHLFDGCPRNVASGKRFFANSKDTLYFPPRFTQAWITAENVNQLIQDSGASGPIDLLSLDMDGVDYWVWKAINVIQPQVVVCETHNHIPADQALTVPYQSNFVCESEEFRSVSLAAMTKLAREKGYRLIGTHRYGFNAFFVKNGVGEKYFPEVDPASCLNDPATRSIREKSWPRIRNLNWQKV